MRHERLFAQPLYLQVRDRLGARIAAGEWKPGVAMPNEADLAREFGVSPGTMRKALDLLEAECLLTRHQGRGTFVKDPTSQNQVARFCNFRGFKGQPIRGDIQTLELAQGTADEREYTRLQLACNEQVYRIKRTCAYEGVIFMIEEVSLPAALFPGLAERDISPHCPVVLAQAYGFLLAKGEEYVSISAASALASEVLKIANASPVLHLDRVLMTREGRPAEWRRGECVPRKGINYVVAMK